MQENRSKRNNTSPRALIKNLLNSPHKSVKLIILCPALVLIICAIDLAYGYIPASVYSYTSKAMHRYSILCFMLCSIAFILGLINRCRNLRLLLAGYTLLIALYSLLSMMLNKFSTTTLIAPATPTFEFNTALAFIFISLGLLFFGTRAHLSGKNALYISLFASISFALGLIPYIGYITHIDSMYTWGALSTIPFSSALCFIVLSMALICYVWLHSDQESFWLPAPVFIALTTITLTMSAAIYTKENNGLENTLSYFSNRGLFPSITQPLPHTLTSNYLIVLVYGALMTLIVTYCVYLIAKSNEKTQALRASEQRYRLLLDGIKDYAIFMLTPCGKIKSWNVGAYRIYDYLDQEIMGKDYATVFLPAHASSIKENLIKARLHGSYEEENLHVRKDGSTFWAKILIQPLWDQTNRLVGFVNITQNVSTRRQMELERSQLIALINESADYVGICDLEGNLRYHNPSAKRTLGYPPDYDMLNLTIDDVHPAWALKLIKEKALPEAYEHGFWSGETALVHVDGHEIPVLQTIRLHRDSLNEPVCFTTIMHDITERKALEEQMKASEQTFKAAMHYAAIATALVSVEGKWLKVNQAMCNLLGYTEEELQNIDFQTLTYPDDLPKDIEHMERILNHQTDSYQMEKRYFHKKGHIIWGLLDVTLLREEDGSPKCFISQIQNITGRKDAEFANKKLMEGLANSNSELERFAYVASHDLQEPVRMINNFGEMLLTEKSANLDEEAREYLTIMTSAGIRMRQVIQDLLAYSRIGRESTHFIDFDGEDILQSALENIQALIEEQGALITHDKLPKFYGNPMQIMRLFQNLLTNAIKYQKPGNQPQIKIRLEEDEAHWYIKVSDNGIGIDSAFIDEIFEPFRRLHSWDTVKGSGLGLSICKKIIEIHQGLLTVQSEIGKGSEFIIKLPKNNPHNGS